MGHTTENWQLTMKTFYCVQKLQLSNDLTKFFNTCVEKTSFKISLYYQQL